MEFYVSTSKKYEVIDITPEVERIVNSSGVKRGLCTVYVPHATAGIIVNEFEPNIADDYITLFRTLIPRVRYRHNEIDNNAEAHLLSSLFGASRIFIVENSSLVLGTWQRIILCEFDGPRKRKVIVTLTE